MSSSSELDKRPAVDVHDEPSAEWGWHGSFPKAVRIAGWASTVGVFGLLIGIAMIAMLVRDQVRGRTSWRR